MKGDIRWVTDERIRRVDAPLVQNNRDVCHGRGRFVTGDREAGFEETFNLCATDVRLRSKVFVLARFPDGWARRVGDSD